MRTALGQPVRLADYRVPDFLVDSVELDISLDRHATRVVATLVDAPASAGAGRRGAGARRRRTQSGRASSSMARRSPPAPSTASPASFTLLKPPRRPFTLRIETRLDPAANTKLMGLYRSGSAYCTQCEAEGFRRITYFLDRPDVLSTYRVRLEADKAEAPVLLANGNLEARGDVRGTARHFAIWRDPLQEALLSLRARRAAISAHVADSFVTASGREVALGVYVEHGREDRAAYAMDALKRSMALGRDAPLGANTISTFQHRRRLRLQYGGDGEQGAQRLQRQIRAGLAARPRPTTITPASRASSRTNISTTGPATASPAATGSSSA